MVVATLFTSTNPKKAVAIKIVIGDELYDSLIVQSCNIVDANTRGHALLSTRIGAQVVWPPEALVGASNVARSAYAVKEHKICMLAMHNADGDMRKLHGSVLRPFPTNTQKKDRTITNLQKTEYERMKANELSCFVILRAMLKETSEMAKEYGLIQMDAKAANYLCSIDPPNGQTLSVEVHTADYGGLCTFEHPYATTTFPAGWFGFEAGGDANRYGRHNKVPIQEDTCLAQFAVVLIELLDVHVITYIQGNSKYPSYWDYDLPYDLLENKLDFRRTPDEYHKYLGYVLDDAATRPQNEFIPYLTEAQKEWIRFCSRWDNGPNRKWFLGK